MPDDKKVGGIFTPIVYIYALKNPITDEIRYIGKAKDPKKRLKRHFVPREKPLKIIKMLG
jgi:excinuclease UvrABC nuclease subunit